MLLLGRYIAARAAIGIDWASCLPAAVQINSFQIIGSVRYSLRVKPRIGITGGETIALAHCQRGTRHDRRRHTRAFAFLFTIEAITKIVNFETALPRQLHTVRETCGIELRELDRGWSRTRNYFTARKN